MNYDLKIFSNQYPIVQRFVQHLAYYRAAKPVYARVGMKSPFWCATIDAHLKMATIDWCKVFGADGCNATHWKKTALVAVNDMQESFRQKVATKTGLARPAWKKYHKSMLALRNKYIAHCEIGFASPVPDFDTALNVAYAYDEWVRDLIRPDVFTGPRLREYYAIWMKQAALLVEKAMLATKAMKE